MTDLRLPAFQQLPVVVKNLLIINILVFLLCQVLGAKGIDTDGILALHYWQSPQFRWWQLFTHMFMHANLMHIGFNMFSLWMFGRILENVWGPKRFLLFYMICGLGAAFCHLGVLSFEFNGYLHDMLAYQQHPSLAAFQHFIAHHHVDVNPASMAGWLHDPNSPDQIAGSVDFLKRYYYGDANMPGMISEATVGASGAICGLLFAFGYLFPNTELFIFFIPIPIKAKWAITGFIVFELFQGVNNSAGDNIAHFAHLGGMLFAFILLKVWGRTVRDRFY